MKCVNGAVIAKMYRSDDVRWMNYEDEAFVEWYWQRKTEVKQQNHIPVPLCPQMPHGLSCD